MSRVATKRQKTFFIYLSYYGYLFNSTKLAINLFIATTDKSIAIVNNIFIFFTNSDKHGTFARSRIVSLSQDTSSRNIYFFQIIFTFPMFSTV